MNKTLLGIAVTLIGLTACTHKKEETKAAQKKEADFVTLEGKIKIGTSEKEKVYYLIDPTDVNQSIKKKLFLKEDGTFKDTIQSIKEGYYLLTNSEGKELNLYLKKGAVVQIHTNATKTEFFRDSLVVKGNVESEFLAAFDKFKDKNFNSDAKKLFALSEKEFKVKVDALKTNSNQFIENYKGLPQAAKSVATLEVLYGWGSLLENYPMAHAQISQDAQYRPSATFYDFTKELTCDDEKLFKSNVKYRNYAIMEIKRLLFKDFSPSKDALNGLMNKLKQTKYPTYINDYMLLMLSSQGIQPIPLYEQYESYILKNRAQQVEMVRKQNPTVQIPPPPTQAQLKEMHKKYVAEVTKGNENVFSKISNAITTPELKQLLVDNYTIIKGLKKGDVAPVVDVLKDGKTIDVIAENKGKSIVICFWNFGSATQSKEELPAFEKLATEFKGKEIVFVSVNLDLVNQKEKWGQYTKDNKFEGLSYRATNDLDSKFVKQYGIQNRPLPRYVIIDKEGKIYNYDAPSAKQLMLKKIIEGLTNVK